MQITDCGVLLKGRERCFNNNGGVGFGSRGFGSWKDLECDGVVFQRSGKK